nr:sugar ABC transporter ATP-binding protein [Pyrinomonadaceae bacterium]
MADAPVLEMRHIRKTFPGVVALDDVDFELRRGEVHILLGENGAGKSTLMKILSGAYQKSAGQIIFDYAEVEIKNPKHAQTLVISTIYQEFNLIPHLSVWENIFLGREPKLLPGLIDQREIFQAATRALNDLGLNLDPRRLVKE